jgi:hypothetical protein
VAARYVLVSGRDNLSNLFRKSVREKTIVEEKRQWLSRRKETLNWP